MSAFGGKADMTFCGNPLSRSLLGLKWTSLCAPHMSAFDPKRTSALLPRPSLLGGPSRSNGYFGRCSPRLVRLLNASFEISDVVLKLFIHLIDHIGVISFHCFETRRHTIHDTVYF